ncbi:hypothetical protein [Amnibacterium setariae]|uniref:hypothetical protein n=1 Tax=Amnibacterium setariae TaxID=2306585 RepID=UPI0011C3B8B7|nr:hypothetical protein [Amnibacterium setariae]
MKGWEVELIVARGDREQRAAARDTDRGLLRRVRGGVYVLAGDVAGLRIEELHLVAMRALASATERPLLFSHQSAAVAHGLPVLGPHLARVHVTVERAGDRYFERAAGHVFAVRDEEVVEVGGLLLTAIGRTVVDVAGSGTFEEGVVTADAALAAGLSRELLEQAVDLAGPRRAWRRIQDVVAFADGAAQSPGESVSRVTMRELGLRPVLQHRMSDRRGVIGDADFWFPEEEVAGEFDGFVKFLDPRYAPAGAGRKVYDEKIREDRGRAVTKGWARWGWVEARSRRLLGAVLHRAGVRVPRLVR